MSYVQIEGLIIGLLFWLAISSMIYEEYAGKEEISFSYRLNYSYWQSPCLYYRLQNSLRLAQVPPRPTQLWMR